MEKLKVMDLFAGAGGLSSGFEQTGKFKVKVAVEINENARKTYEMNHGENVRLFDDITALEYLETSGEIKKEYNDIDVIIGGPPCQGFSNANRQHNTLISTNNQLIKEYLRAIEQIRPKAFVMENVKTLESEKHKFFLTESDKTEVEELNIKLIDEYINIGGSNSYSERLQDFIINAYDSGLDNLEEYTLNKEVVSKLKSILKYTKNQPITGLLEYFNKGKNYQSFLRLLNKQWEQAHQKYWDIQYKEIWFNLADTLKNKLEKIDIDLTNFNNDLFEILETQKVIFKVSEIMQNKVILNKINVNQENFEIHIKSFNVFDYIQRKLSSLNYVFNKNDYIFNAADYGVPQVRKRLILIGVHRDFKDLKEIKKPDPILSEEKYFKIKDAIKDIENLCPNTNVIEDEMDRSDFPPLLDSPLNKFLNNNENIIYNHVMTNSRDTALKRFEALSAGQNFHDLDDSLKTTYSDHSRTQNTIYKRLSYEDTADTVVNVRKSMWIHPSKHRAISIREAARLQSFQDSYKFFGSKDSQYQQIGNAVPPLLARAVAEGLLELMGERVKVKIKDILFSKDKVNV